MNPPINPTQRIRKFFFHTLPIIGVFLLPLSVRAQESEAVKPPPTEEVVQLEAFNVSATIGTYHEAASTMATKLPMDLKEIASSLSIMNATAITDRNAVTLTDVFNYVVGATQSQGNINGFSFRGFPNTGSYTQNIQFDGLMGATLKKAATSAANVDSLEFLKGPNGVLYGQMNPGGLLNIVTKRPKEKAETSVRFTMGTFAGEFSGPGNKNTFTASLDKTGPIGNSKHLFYRLIIDAASSPNSRKGNWDQALSYYPSVTYKWSANSFLTIKGEISQDFRRQDDGVMPIFTSPAIPVVIGLLTATPTTTAAYGPTATYFTAPLNTIYQDVNDKATDRGEAAALFFQTTFSNWTLRVQGRSVWHLDVVREFTINNANTVYNPTLNPTTAAYSTPISLIRRQYNYVKNGHRYNFGDANIFRIFTTGKLQQTLLFGAGGGGEFFGNSRLAFGPNQVVTLSLPLTHPTLGLASYPADGTGTTNQITYQTAFGEYVSDQIKVGDSLHVSLGVRRDHQKVHGVNTLSPALTAFSSELVAYTKQAGVVYDINKNFSPYFSYSQSIKPQVNIAFDAAGNSAFPPESGEQYEAGLKFDTLNKNVNITVAAYEINRSNVLVASGTNFTAAGGAYPVPPGSIAQVGQPISRLDGGQQSKGFEIEAQWQPLPNWQLQTGYASSKAVITSSAKNPTTIGFDLANAPRKSGNFWTRYNFTNSTFKGLGIGTGIIYVGDAWAGDPTTAVYYQLKAWTRVDSSLYYVWKRYNFALNIQNLFDRRYIGSAQSAITLNIGEQRKLTFSMGTKF